MRLRSGRFKSHGFVWSDPTVKMSAFTLYKLLFSSQSRLASVLKLIFHQCVKSYTCSQSSSDGSVLKTEPSELGWLQV